MNLQYDDAVTDEGAARDKEFSYHRTEDRFLKKTSKRALYKIRAPANDTQ